MDLGLLRIRIGFLIMSETALNVLLLPCFMYLCEVALFRIDNFIK